MPRINRDRFPSMKEKMKRAASAIKRFGAAAKESVKRSGLLLKRDGKKLVDRLKRMTPKDWALVSTGGGLASFAVAAALAHPLVGMAVAVPLMFGGGIGSLYKEVSRTQRIQPPRPQEVPTPPSEAHEHMREAFMRKYDTLKRMLEEARNPAKSPYARVVGAGILGGLAYAAAPLGLVPSLALGSAALGLTSYNYIKEWVAKRKMKKLAKIASGEEAMKTGVSQRHFINMRNPLSRLRGSVGEKELFWGEVESKALEGDHHTVAAVVSSVIRKNLHQDEITKQKIVEILSKHPEAYFLILNKYGPNHPVVRKLHSILNEASRGQRS